MTEIKNPPYDGDDSIVPIFEKHRLWIHRMIGASKSRYCRNHPGHFAVFNANVFTLAHGKVWHGDLDLAVDAAALKSVAAELGCTLFVLSEFDGRFENRDRRPNEIMECAVWTTERPVTSWAEYYRARYSSGT